MNNVTDNSIGQLKKKRKKKMQTAMFGMANWPLPPEDGKHRNIIRKGKNDFSSLLASSGWQILECNFQSSSSSSESEVGSARLKNIKP